MTVQRTFSIIKPDGIHKNIIGTIYSRFEAAGLKVVAAKMLHLSEEQAAGFYAEHKGKPFYDKLIQYMTSGPIMVQVLEGENAVQANRQIMGATNPAEAASGTIRFDFATSLTMNTVHGADAPETAAREIAYFFSDDEVCPRTYTLLT